MSINQTPTETQNFRAIADDSFAVSLQASDILDYQKGAPAGLTSFNLSLDPLASNKTSFINLGYPIPPDLMLEFCASISQRTQGSYASLGIVNTSASFDNPISIEDTPDIALASAQQSTTTLTLVLATPFVGAVDTIIDVYGISDNRLNYCNLVVATVSADGLTLTATVANGATIPSLTVGPFATQGSISVVNQLMGNTDGAAIRWDGVSATAASLIAKFNGNAVNSTGTIGGVQTSTIGSSANVYSVATTGQIAIKPTTKYAIAIDKDSVVFQDKAVDSTSGSYTSRGIKSNAKPNYSLMYQPRLRTRTPISIARPIAKIVSAVKAASTTATITTDVPHGLATGNYVNIAGIRDTVNFANTPGIAVTVVNSTSFTCVIPTSATATSYGGMVGLANGGSAQPGLVAQTVQSAAVAASGLVTLIGSATWSGISVGDYVNLYGCRDNTTGADMGLDGMWRVNTLSTTTLVLQPVLDYQNVRKSPPFAYAFTTANCGGCVISRMTIYVSDLSFSHIQYLDCRLDGQGSTRADKALPVNVTAGTVTTVSTVSTLSAISAGTNLIADVGIQYRSTSGTTAQHLIASASTNAAVIKAAAGKIIGWSLANTTAAWVYVKFHNQTTSPTAGSGVVRTVGIPPNGKSDFTVEGGIAFATGIALTTVTDPLDAGTTAVTASAIVGEIIYA